MGPDRTLPTVTVAVLSHDRREAVRTTLTKVLRELDYPLERMEVILVDNASADGTPAMVADEFPSVSIIALERNVGAAGWNEAFAVARGDWVLILDDDCWIEGAALQEAVGAARAHRAELVSFRVRSSIQPDHFFNDEYPTGLLSYWGCAALISRRALHQLKGYDPAIFIWGNELDLTMRLLDRGWRHVYSPAVVAVHMKPPKTQDEVFQAAKHRVQYRNYGYIVGKLLRPADAGRVLARLATAMLLEMRVWSPRAAADLPALFAGFLRGLRAREPLRPEVSAAYRDGFVSFSNPLEVLRRPWDRVGKGHRAPTVNAARAARWERFHAARRRFYPRETAVLEL